MHIAYDDDHPQERSYTPTVTSGRAALAAVSDKEQVTPTSTSMPSACWGKTSRLLAFGLWAAALLLTQLPGAHAQITCTSGSKYASTFASALSKSVRWVLLLSREDPGC